MSSTQNPLAARLQRQLGRDSPTRLLATIMGLPLLDGIFPTLVAAGSLNSLSGAIEVGILLFGGSATAAVILTELPPDTRGNLLRLLSVGGLLTILALLEAALAPTVASLVEMHVFRWFAASVILVIAGKTASSTIGSWLPRPASILLIGGILSASPGSVVVQVSLSTSLLVHTVIAVGSGIVFAAGIIVGRQYLLSVVDLDRIRFGGALALALVAFSVLGVVSSKVSLLVLALSVALAVTGKTDETTTEESVPDSP